MKIVPISNISSNDIIGIDIIDSSGNILVKKGSAITPQVQKRFEELGIGAIYIEEKLHNAKEINFDEGSFKQILLDVEKYFRDGEGNYYSSAPKWQPLDGNSLANSVDKLSEVVEHIRARYDPYFYPIHLLSYMKEFDHFTFIHNLNVAVLSVLLGTIIDLDGESLFKLAIGSLFHDLGKLTIPMAILLKEERLTEFDWRYIKSHPQDGLVMLRESNIPAASKTIVLQHHERFDGQGYPRGRSGNDIHLLSRITTLADVYDALTSARPYRNAFSPSEVIEFLLGGRGTHFDYDLVVEFADKIAPYPVGTVVRLSNGAKGIVTKLNKTSPTRPTVKIVRSSSEKQEKQNLIDLWLIRNITIKDVIKEKIKSKTPPAEAVPSHS